MDTTTTRAVTIADDSKTSAISWTAVAAGAVAASALTLLLLAFGAGMGFSAISPWSGSGVSGTTFKIGTGLYLIVVAMLASTIGGYLAGRLRTRWVDAHTHEVYFRDTAHGFLTWALATVLSAAFLASAAASIAGGSGILASAASGPSAAERSGSAGLLDYYVEALLRRDPTAAAASSDPAAGRAEVTHILTAALRDGGDLNAIDRAYLATLVAARSSVTPADADRRVAEVVTRAKSALDDARKAAARLSLWLAASLLIGAFTGSLAATEGGHVRDNWNPDRPAGLEIRS
jgi:hypothetical protein